MMVNPIGIRSGLTSVRSTNMIYTYSVFYKGEHLGYVNAMYDFNALEKAFNAVTTSSSLYSSANRRDITVKRVPL